MTHVLNNGKQLFFVFIDYTKAFDYVVRDKLWSKFIKLGLRGNILNSIRSMYTAVRSRVTSCCDSKSEQVLTNSVECTFGVRQGDRLSPFLFSIFLTILKKNSYIRAHPNVKHWCSLLKDILYKLL